MCFLRFIPAYAGNSKQLLMRSYFNSVHPRLRGELVSENAPDNLRVRFIPAYAGNSSDSILITANHYGSSPLTRGTQFRSYAAIGKQRFIPAYAGNSIVLQGVSPKDAVHPRLRGELHAYSYASRLNRGSSPLTRGTRLYAGALLSSRRFIPAYAGNSKTVQENL